MGAPNAHLYGVFRAEGGRLYGLDVHEHVGGERWRGGGLVAFRVGPSLTRRLQGACALSGCGVLWPQLGLSVRG